jgi:hypothetical protein
LKLIAFKNLVTKTWVCVKVRFGVFMFAKHLQSHLEIHETIALLQIFSRVGIDNWLHDNPFSALHIRKDVMLHGIPVNGWFSYQENTATIATSRDSKEWAEQLVWGRTDRLSLTAPTAFEAIQFTLLHELGHRLHLALLFDAALFRMPWLLPRSDAVTNYAKSANAEEYFAESFVAWIFYRTELFAQDQLAYAMIQRALDALGIEVFDLGYSNYFQNRSASS